MQFNILYFLFGGGIFIYLNICLLYMFLYGDDIVLFYKEQSYIDVLKNEIGCIDILSFIGIVRYIKVIVKYFLILLYF